MLTNFDKAVAALLGAVSPFLLSLGIEWNPSPAELSFYSMIGSMVLTYIVPNKVSP